MTAWTGTWRLARLALRRDRIMLPVWIVGITLLTWAGVQGVASAYASEAERAAGASFAAANSATRIFDGPASGTDIGSMAMVETMGKLAIYVALMSGQAIIRHTRREEETGRAELVGASVVGRYARLTAALAVAVGASLVLGACVAAVVAANDLPWAGSLLAGATITGVGICFAGIAAVAAQIATTQRGSNAIVGAALGLAFVLRATGDALGTIADGGVRVVSAWPSWLSPIGWAQQVRAFDQDNWGVVALFGALAVVLVAVAYALTSRRDLGAGMVRERSGPASAPAALLSPFGLAWRLQRMQLLAWGCAAACWSAPLGALGDSANDMADASAQLKQLLEAIAPGASMVDLYFAYVMGLLGIVAAAYTVQALLRMRTEEATGRLEPLLSSAGGRRRWLASHAVIAAAGSVVVLLVSGVSGAIGYWAVTGDLGGAVGVIGAATVYVPAVLVVGAFVITAFALAPRWAPAIAWFALAAVLTVSQFGDTFDLPQWALNVSPFTHIPLVPARALTLGPLFWLVGAAAALVALSFAAFRRRDLAIAA